MVLLLNGTPGFVARAWKKIGLLGDQKTHILLPSIWSNALNRSNNRDWCLHAHLFLFLFHSKVKKIKQNSFRYMIVGSKIKGNIFTYTLLQKTTSTKLCYKRKSVYFTWSLIRRPTIMLFFFKWGGPGTVLRVEKCTLQLKLLNVLSTNNAFFLHPFCQTVEFICETRRIIISHFIIMSAGQCKMFHVDFSEKNFLFDPSAPSSRHEAWYLY